MKAITLWQPWASLIQWGEKRYETRSWPTSYRGLLAIHAGKQADTQKLLDCNSFYREAFARHGIPFNPPLPAGAVLCLVQLVDCCPTENVTRNALPGFGISQKEQQFGDYSSGRFAWKLENVRVLDSPIQYRGAQGLWDWPVDVESLTFRKAQT